MDTIVSAMWSLLEKPERWMGLSDIEDQLSDPNFYQAFVDVWRNSESNHLNLPLIDELIERRDVCASRVMPHLSTRDREVFDALRDEPTVFRGATVERPFADYTWTTDRDHARWLAERCTGATPALITGTVDPKAVLFAYAVCGESEVAVRSDDVAKKVIEPIAPFRKDQTLPPCPAIRPGSLDALFDPIAMLTSRFRSVMQRDGARAMEVRRTALVEIGRLEDIGFKSVAQVRRQLLEQVDWDGLDTGGSAWANGSLRERDVRRVACR